MARSPVLRRRFAAKESTPSGRSFSPSKICAAAKAASGVMYSQRPIPRDCPFSWKIRSLRTLPARSKKRFNMASFARVGALWKKTQCLRAASSPASSKGGGGGGAEEEILCTNRGPCSSTGGSPVKTRRVGRASGSRLAPLAVLVRLRKTTGNGASLGRN